jgi:hypothetical protein
MRLRRQTRRHRPFSIKRAMPGFDMDQKLNE